MKKRMLFVILSCFLAVCGHAQEARCPPGDIEYAAKIIKESEWEYWVEISLSSKGAKELWVTMTCWDLSITISREFKDVESATYRSMSLPYGSDTFFEFKAINDYGTKELHYCMSQVY